ncbi:hypothetical protein HPO96_37070 [Kribbella sandramycini]|uniref:LAGLIDADG DNA endonuclease family protein n=1 Tax=Kribbella sandramycini TaxID=60450 RepID=A0A7Y4P2X9_9ACTN|nr:hypothetical protein [Kribbella sandramycini]MBB6564411.1 hypothetical protein [Kribbella sandramycini]NOL45872.1 hypothetical protein [Kribbella sandramycini]
MNVPDARSLTSVQSAWLAGILDGEGCFDMTHSSPRLRVKMSDHDVVLRAAELMNARVHIEPPRQQHHKPCMVAQVHGDDAVAVMRAVLPHLGARRTAKVTEIILAHSNRQARRASRHLKAA